MVTTEYCSFRIIIIKAMVKTSHQSSTSLMKFGQHTQSEQFSPSLPALAPHSSFMVNLFLIIIANRTLKINKRNKEKFSTTKKIYCTIFIYDCNDGTLLLKWKRLKRNFQKSKLVISLYAALYYFVWKFSVGNEFYHENKYSTVSANDSYRTYIKWIGSSVALALFVLCVWGFSVCLTLSSNALRDWKIFLSTSAASSSFSPKLK